MKGGCLTPPTAPEEYRGKEQDPGVPKYQYPCSTLAGVRPCTAPTGCLTHRTGAFTSRPAREEGAARKLSHYSLSGGPPGWLGPRIQSKLVGKDQGKGGPCPEPASHFPLQSLGQSPNPAVGQQGEADGFPFLTSWGQSGHSLAVKTLVSLSFHSVSALWILFFFSLGHTAPQH